MSRDNPQVIPEEDGLYPGVMDLHYFQWGALSQSRLKHFERSPAHYRHEIDQADDSQTRAQKKGSAFHVATLQPDQFDDWFRARPEGHPNSNAYKARVEEIRAENPFVRILRQDDIDDVRRMADAVRGHPLAGPLLEGSRSEVSGVWTDPEFGIRCKMRVDSVAEDMGALVDLKSTRDARPDPFGKDAWNYRYYRQAAFYLRGAEALGLDASDFAFVAVEKDEPFGIIVYEAPDELLVMAQDELDGLLALFAWCNEHDQWPSYGDQWEELELPGWAIQKLEYRLEEGITV